MKQQQLLSFTIILTFCLSANAQMTIRPHLSATYMQHSQLMGFSVANDIGFSLKKGTFILGGIFSYGEGNRNFDPSVSGAYNLEFGDYFPEFQFGQFPSLQAENAIELQVKTSTTYQFTAKMGYAFPSKTWGSLEVGIYGTYVNKSYLADVLYDFDIYWELAQQGFNIDFAIPYHFRYLDTGPYISYSKPIFKNFKLPTAVKATSFWALKNNNWYDLGLMIEF